MRMIKVFLRTLLLILTLFIGVSVHAIEPVQFTLLPQEKSASVGENFYVSILFDPKGETIDTVRVYVEFPALLLEIVNTQIGTLFPNVSPGNTIDNEKGFLSLGAYNLQGGVTKSGIIGKITFKGKKTGISTVRIVSDSHAFSEGVEKLDTSVLGEALVTVTSSDDVETTTLSVSSLTHPNQDQWYQGRSMQINWTTKEIIKAYFTAFDQEPDTEPTQKWLGSAEVTEFTQDIPDGIWYFHLKGEKKLGGFTESVHFRVQVDQTAPSTLAVTADNAQLSAGKQTLVWFGTIDELSGVDHYEVAVNDAVFTPQSSPIMIKDTKPGTYLIRVKAIDQARNEIYGQTSIRVYEKGVFDEGIGAEVVSVQKNIERLWIFIASLLIISGIIGVMYFRKKNYKKKK